MEKKFHIWTGLTQLKGYLEMSNIVVVMECLHMFGSQGCKNPQYSIVDKKMSYILQCDSLFFYDTRNFITADTKPFYG